MSHLIHIKDITLYNAIALLASLREWFEDGTAPLRKSTLLFDEETVLDLIREVEKDLNDAL